MAQQGMVDSALRRIEKKNKEIEEKMQRELEESERELEELERKVKELKLKNLKMKLKNKNEETRVPLNLTGDGGDASIDSVKEMLGIQL